MKTSANRYNPANIAIKEINFKRLSEQYHDMFCSYAEKFVGKNDAEDMVQDALENLFMKNESNIIIENLSSYLFRNIKHNCLDYLKHEKVKRKHRELVQSLYDNDEIK